ncbi:MULTISPECIES: hypothetical protein [Acinetobacter]|nr:hypothetical protein [Acinetobacter sp. HR7]KGT46988.1 hypothetical protein GW12_19540 [Acinetobacter sp. HR7]
MTSHRKTSKLHPFAQFLVDILSVRAGLHIKQDLAKESKRV